VLDLPSLTLLLLLLLLLLVVVVVVVVRVWMTFDGLVLMWIPMCRVSCTHSFAVRRVLEVMHPKSGGSRTGPSSPSALVSSIRVPRSGQYR